MTTTVTKPLKPVKVLLKKDFSPHKRFVYDFTIYDLRLKDDFVITIPGKEWNRHGNYGDFTVKQWEEFTGHSFY